MSIKAWIVLIFVVLSVVITNAQVRQLELTENLTIADGLAHNGVTSILKDSRGYLWIGTYDGINRYDGYGFTIFKNTPDKKLFVSNRIRCIAEDFEGNIWMGTDEGISIYNYSQQSFSNIFSNKTSGKSATGPIVRHILAHPENDLIVCSTEKEGILFFKTDYSFVKQFKPSEEFSNQPVLFIKGIALDQENFIFITTAGILHFNLTTEKFTKVLQVNTNRNNTIEKIADNKLLVTLNQGVAIVSYLKESRKYVFELEALGMQEQQFRKVSVDSLGNIWLTSLNEGVVQINHNKLVKNGQFITTASYDFGAGLFRASSIITDENIGCWIGAFNGGIFRFNINENPFRRNNTQNIYDFTVHANRAGHMSAFDKDRFFMTAQNNGVAIYNTKSHRFEALPPQIVALNSPQLGAIFVDSRKDIWLNYNNPKGLRRLNTKSGTIESMSDIYPEYSIMRNIRSIYEGDEGNIWIVDADNLYRISIDTEGNITQYESLRDNSFFTNHQLALVRCVLFDPLTNSAWVGTGADGLFRLSFDETGKLETAQIEQYTHNEKERFSVSSNFISTITRLPNGELWIGTERGGICKLINTTNKTEFITFSEEHGLSNNVVKSIDFSDDGNLWISTNIGLNKFDTKSNQFRIFKGDNGLPFEDFYYATEKMGNGYFVMSGLNGFCYFKPNDIPANEHLPKLEFNNLKIFNTPIYPGDSIGNRVILEKSLTESNEIVLKHNENVLSLELTSLHFSTPENHYLRYQLLPINEEWVLVSSEQRTVNYNGLQPGEYELRVMASNSLNEWTAPKTLKIKIEPPFWRTVPAYLLYVLVIGLIIYSVMYYILRMNRLQHNLEIEHLEKENVKEVNAAKLRFFSNISHEIKTPLTLISGPVELMTDRYKGNPGLTEKLQIVRRQSRKIWQLIDQVHDFQRSDANKLKMNNAQFCINDFINELVADFHFMAETEKKDLKFIPYSKRIYVYADKDKLEKILNNILNNAFKYTKSGDSITILFSAEDKELQISVSDTGRGIAADDLPHVFERFYQSSHKHSEYTGGSGIGLAFTKRLVEMHYGYIGAESLLGEGTTMSMKFPIVIPKPEGVENEIEAKILSNEKKLNVSSQAENKFDLSKIDVEGNFTEAVIFFAEDNVEMRRFVREALSNFFKVKTFRNGLEMHEALNEEWPDIIISDILMPEMNGFDLCKSVKSDIKTCHIPIILLTACTTIDEQLKGLREGADSYITKPFEMQHLITRVETLLMNRKKLRERYKIDFPLTISKKEQENGDLVFLEKLYNQMEENLDNLELDMDILAKKMFLNRTHFFQKVKALTNQTPYELLKMYRLKRAAELLVQKHLSVNEVYMMTGFKSRSNFSKLFKEKYDSTPGKYASDALKST